MDLKQKTVPELKAMAKELGISGTDGMKKQELMDAIQQLQFDGFDVEPSQGSAGDEASKPDQTSEPASWKPNKVYENHPKFDKFKKGNEK